MTEVVGFDLNLGGNYSQSMSQAVAVSQQYVSVADGIRGKMVDMSSAMVGATARLTGFNKMNTVALDTAGAYQKALSGIEATAVVTGKSFDTLSANTRKLARDFPVGMAGAVAVVEGLQEVGIKSESALGSLSASVVKLGAATNTYAPQIGKDFVQLSRAFGNGTTQFEALGDSLTTVTKTIGGSASSVVAFSKALAPVAATVGIGQTSVMGLSAAMSTLGEDGYRAANTFNKVLLDMNRSIRDGGPELKAYSDMMGMTRDSLKNLFTEDPAEVLARFSDAVAKAGPEVSRTLDALGFDSVRDTRSLTALARAGGPRKAIQTAVEGYGSGSTAESADKALNGVSDAAARLQETMGQTVANVGRPMLPFAQMQLGAMQGVASIGEKFTGLEPVQKVGSVLAGAQSIGGAAMTAGNVILGASMLKMMGKAIGGSSFAQAFKESWKQGTVGGATPTAMHMPMPGAMGPAGRPLTKAEQAIANAARSGGAFAASKDIATPKTAMGALARFTSASAGMSADAMARLTTGFYSNVARGGMGEEKLSTPAGREFTARRAEIGAMRETGEISRWRQLRLLRDATTTYTKSLDPNLAKSMGNLGRAVGGSAMDVGRAGVGMVGSTVGRTAGLIGAAGSALGVTAPLAGVAAAAGAGYMVYKGTQDSQEAIGKIAASKDDIYANFNAFAEATGQAGRGLVSFSAQVSQTTESLARDNKTMGQALTLTQAEQQAATTPGYKSAFKIQGDSFTPEAIAGQVMSMLGAEPNSQDVQRVLMDVAAQTSVATMDQVTELLKKQGLGDGTLTPDYSMMRKGIQENASTNPFGILGGVSEAQGGIAASNANAMQQRAYVANQRFGGTLGEGKTTINAGQAVALQDLLGQVEEARKAGVGNPLSGGMPDGPLPTSTWSLLGKITEWSGNAYATQNQIAQGAGLSEEDAAALGLQTNGGFLGLNGAKSVLLGGPSMEQRLMENAQGENPTDIALAYKAAKDQGIDLKDPNLGAFGQTTEAIEEAKRFATEMDKATGSAGNLTKSFYALSDAVTKSGKAPGEIPGSFTQSFSEVTKALQKSMTEKTPMAEIDLGKKIYAEVLRDFGGSSSRAEQALRIQQSATSQQTDPQKYAGIEQALQLASVQGAWASQQKTPAQIEVSRQQVASDARNMQVNNTTTASSVNIEQQRATASDTDALAQGQQWLQSYQSLLIGIKSAQRSAGVQAGSIARDGALKLVYAEEDYQRSRKRSIIQYNTAVERTEEQFTKSRFRAKRDYDISIEQATQDHVLAKTRMERDYNKQTWRANRDFGISLTRAYEERGIAVARAERDFKIGQERATRDFNKQQMRAEQDFGTQMERANRDRQVQVAQAEQDYLRARTRALEDYNKQVKRMVEDSAKAMYDPYKRIAAQMVMDAGQLVTNLKDQTDALNKQVGNLAQARAMGMTNETIKALSLSDAANAQQLQRIVEDSKGNPDFIAQLNTGVAAKQTAAAPLVTDAGSTGFSRMQEDFATGQARAEEDYQTAVVRGQESFARQMSDAQADFTKSMVRAREDFATQMADSTEDFKKSMKDSVEDFDRQIRNMYEDHFRMLADAEFNYQQGLDDLEVNFGTFLTRTLAAFIRAGKDATVDHNTNLRIMGEDHERQLKWAAQDYERTVERIKTATANALADVGAGLAAQVQAMKDSFFGIGKIATDELGVAQSVFDALGVKVGEDPKPWWSNETLGKWTWADGIINKYKEIEEANKKWAANAPKPGDYQAGAGTTVTPPSTAGGNSQIPFAPADQSMFDNFWPKTWDFLVPDIDFAGIWETLMSRLKAGFAVITDFDWVARKLGEGLGIAIKGVFAGGSFIKDTIGDTFSNAWNFLTVDIPNIKDAVLAKFTEAGAWLANLGAHIVVWMMGAWDNLTGGPAGEGMPDIRTIVEGKFIAMGEYVLGLPERILGWVGSAWDGLTSQVPQLKDFGEVVEEKFNAAKVWLEGLGGKIGTWIGEQWNALTAGLASLIVGKDSIGQKVIAAFEGAVSYVTKFFGIGEGSLSGMISDKWNELWHNFPTPADGLKVITEAFEGADGQSGLKGFIKGIPDWLIANVPGADRIFGAFSSLTEGIKSVVRGLMETWNALDFTIDIGFGPINNLGGFKGWDSKTLTDMFGNEHTIIPDFAGWDGFTIPKVQVGPIDVFPNIPIPSILKAKIGGGPVERGQSYVVGEAGPELFLAPNDGMVLPTGMTNRLLSGIDAKSSMVQPYATPVYNTYHHSEDYSTRITGPITVIAQDPDAMAEKLAARQRRQRLANPVGSR
jgi:hypothetical protein